MRVQGAWAEIVPTQQWKSVVWGTACELGATLGVDDRAPWAVITLCRRANHPCPIIYPIHPVGVPLILLGSH